MNCKPGDLALVIRESKRCPDQRICGRMVEVLRPQPAERFQLPDGRWHIGLKEEKEFGPSWVVRFSEALQMPRRSGARILSYYGCCQDISLRPIRPQPDDIETPTKAEVPA